MSDDKKSDFEDSEFSLNSCRPLSNGLGFHNTHKPTQNRPKGLSGENQVRPEIKLGRSNKIKSQSIKESSPKIKVSQFCLSLVIDKTIVIALSLFFFFAPMSLVGTSKYFEFLKMFSLVDYALVASIVLIFDYCYFVASHLAFNSSIGAGLLKIDSKLLKSNRPLLTYLTDFFCFATFFAPMLIPQFREYRLGKK